jgi:hypothetical protein
MEQFHLDHGPSIISFPQIETARTAFDVGHNNSSIIRPAELSVVQGVRYSVPLWDNFYAAALGFVGSCFSLSALKPNLTSSSCTIRAICALWRM